MSTEPFHNGAPTFFFSTSIFREPRYLAEGLRWCDTFVSLANSIETSTGAQGCWWDTGYKELCKSTALKERERRRGIVEEGYKKRKNKRKKKKKKREKRKEEEEEEHPPQTHKKKRKEIEELTSCSFLLLFSI